MTAVAAPTSIELVTTKFELPSSRPGVVRRTGLLRRLRTTSSGVVTIVAPAGFGATTLLDRWSREDERPFAYVALDPQDDDPRAILSSIVEALVRAGVLGGARAWPTSRSPVETIRRLAASLRASAPFVLAVDDLHEIEREDTARTLASMAGAVPTGSVLALAGRRAIPVRIEPDDGDAVLLEVGPKELALTAGQVRDLLRSEGIDPAATDTDQVLERTRGWPVAVYLAALGLSSGALPSAADLTGAFRPIAEFLRVEVLDAMTRRQRRCLERTAPLDPLNAAFCDAVLGTRGSARLLAELVDQGIATVDDADASWFHIHPLVRDALLAELERHGERSALDETLARAAVWSEAKHRVDGAAAYAMETDDTRRVVRLFVRHGRTRHEHGAGSAVHGWLDWLEDRGAFPTELAPLLVAGWITAIDGRAAHAERVLEKIERLPSTRSGDADADAVAGAAFLRAVGGADGPDRMRVDAATGLALGGVWRPAALVVLGAANRIDDRLGSADDVLTDAAERAERAEQRNVALLAVSMRAEIAARRGDHAAVEGHLERAAAIRASRLSSSPTAALSVALAATAAIHRGDAAAAERELALAASLEPALSYAAPWLAVLTLAEIARANAALERTVAARASVDAIDAIMRRRPDLGSLNAEVDVVREAIDVARTDRMRGVAITRAEMRILRELPTYLTFGEIGKRLFVSPHTVKTQALSIYRKLGVTSRAEAIERATALDLLDA